MKKLSTREKLLNAGRLVLFRQGYIGSGIRDIVAEADIPLGSFSNYFRSKEGFVIEVLNRYFENTSRMVSEALNDAALSPRERLKKYLDIITGCLEADGFRRGCLIGDLSLEASPQSEVLRQRLAAIFTEWLVPFKECIAEGQKQGEIPDQFAVDDLAEFLLASWQGAILRMKVEQNSAPLERFKAIALNTVFGGPTTRKTEGEKFLQTTTKKRITMNDYNELTDHYVAMWNERDSQRRGQYVRELWAEDGIECTKGRETRGHDALEARVTASHEKNVRDAGYLFRSCRNADAHHGLVKFNWEMYRPSDGVVESTGFYMLLLNDAGKIQQAWLFVDP